MLDEKKVQLMARTALYEQELGRGTIKQNKNFEKGAEKVTLANNITAGIITFILLVIVAIACKPDLALAQYYRFGLTASVFILAAACIIFVFLYALYSRFMLRRKYEANKGIFWKYNFTREKLNKILKVRKADTDKTGGKKA